MYHGTRVIRVKAIDLKARIGIKDGCSLVFRALSDCVSFRSFKLFQRFDPVPINQVN